MVNTHKEQRLQESSHERFIPNEGNFTAHTRHYERYIKLYDSSRELFETEEEL